MRYNNRRERRRSASLLRKLYLQSEPPGISAWQSRVLAAVATSMFALSQPTAAIAGPDLCSFAAGVATCTGNQSAGIASGTDFAVPATNTLNVNTLNQNIAPPAADGIQFISPSDVTINFDGGGFVINAPGAGSRGINGRVSGNGNTTITSTGDITAHDDGIYGRVDGNGNVSITSTGNIVSTLEEGIDAEVQGNGNITVVSQGTVTSDDEGIDATIRGATGGNISITSTGNITSNDDSGIDADIHQGGDITIVSQGNIMGDNEAINAIIRGNAGGDITITSTGDLTGNDLEAISAYVYGPGNINIGSTGTLKSNDDDGIFARLQGDGDVAINNTGNITSEDIAINVIANGTTTGNITVTSTGNLTSASDDAIETYVYGNGDININSSGTHSATSAGSEGIDALIAGNGNINIQVSGSVNANSEAIEAEILGAGGGNITINNSANLTSATQEGIFAEIGYCACGGSGDITITNTGNITSGNEGIRAEVGSGAAGGTGTITISNTANITAATDEGIFVSMDGGGGGGTGAINISSIGAVTGTTAILVNPRSGNRIPTTITNGGTLTGTGGAAIVLQGDANDVVNLAGGSVIVGSIDFGRGNDNMGGTVADDIDTLNVAPGVNAILNFVNSEAPLRPQDGDLESAPEIITGNVVLINGGTTAVAVDTTGFSGAQTWIDDITGAIIGAVEGLFAPGANGNSDQQAAGFTLPGGNRVSPVSYTDATGKGHRLWTSSFGSAHDEVSGGGNAELSHVLGGLMFGAEAIGGDGFRAGAFGGGSFSNMDVQFGAQNIEVASGFAGLYARKDWAHSWIKALVTGGFANHISRRRVNNAGVAGGIQIARGEYDGAFVAPALSAGAKLAQPSENHSLWGSVRVHYGGLFLDGYTESGVAVPLTVRSRNVQILAARAQLASPFTQLGPDGSVFQFEGRLGLDAQFNLGSGRVNTSVAGTPFSFRAGFDDEIVSGFLGASVTRTTADGRGYLKAASEAHIVSDGSYELRGQFNAGLRF